MAILRGIYPRYICDFEAEKTSLIAGNPNGTVVTVRANGGRDYVLTDGVFVSTGKILKNYTASESESVNATILFVTKLATTFTVTEAAEFQMTWSYEQSNAAANKVQEVQVDINGVTVSLDTISVPAVGLYMVTSTFVNQILAVGSHLIEIKFRILATGAGSSAKIRRVRLDISKT